MDDVDLALIVRVALLVAGEIPEVAARCKDRVDALDLRDFVGVFQAFERFDHQNENDVVVDRIAITARDAAPHVRIESIPAAEAALAERRKIGPVSRRDRLFHCIHGRNHDDQRARIEGMLNLKLVRVGDPRPRNCLRVRTGPPRLSGLIPGRVGVLHLGPDEVVSGIRHGAVGARIDAGRDRAANQFAPGHQLDLGRVPYLGPRRRGKSIAVFPGIHIERPLVDRAGGGHLPRLAVHACRGRQRELALLRIREHTGQTDRSTRSRNSNKMSDHRFLRVLESSPDCRAGRKPDPKQNPGSPWSRPNATPPFG